MTESTGGVPTRAELVRAFAFGCVLIVVIMFALTLPEVPKPKKTLIKGTISANHESVGTWTLKPINCLAGIERGFKGVLFLFAAGSPIRELRLDTEREGDNVVEILFFERERAPVYIREKECSEISGVTTFRIWDINERHVEEVDSANLKIDCPPLQLRTKLEYQGCWP